MKKLLVILLISLVATANAQKTKKEEPPQEFKRDEFLSMLQREFNLFRAQNGLDSMDVMPQLVTAADLSANDMSKVEKADMNAAAKNTPKYLKKAGCTSKGEQYVISVPLGKGKNYNDSKKLVKLVMAKWPTDKKARAVLLNPANVYVGLSCKTDKLEKKVFVCFILGNFQSFNAGAKKKSELKVPYNSKSKKLKNPDVKKCKQCEKFKDTETLRNNLYVENGKIYLKYDNLKNLKRLLKKPTDGLAVDIVQKDQYSKIEYNIMDNNLRNKGVMQKVVYKDKLFSKNLIKPDPKAKKAKKVNKLLVEMGKFPAGITGSYELNLLVIQDNYVCKTVLRSYTEQGDQESNTPLEMLPMPESMAARNPPFEPRSESTILNFIIPFEKNKSEFKPEDIKPFIEALQEPDFIIDGLFIYAYSSIEGDSVANAALQRKRAGSVVKVLQGMQTNKISPTIITNDSWNLFQLEMEDGKFDYLTKMSKREAIKTINTKGGLTQELEPYLAKQRFAQIVMDVTYDITGNKEEKFTLVSFNRAVKGGNNKQAYKIMDFISKKTVADKYSKEIWDNLQIPFEAKYSGLLMNKVYYDYVEHGRVVDEDQYKDIQKLEQLDPASNIIKFNSLLCKVELDSTVGKKADQVALQQRIDALYKTEIPHNIINSLNVEWQFKLMEALDTVENSEAEVQAIVEKIKSFYNFKDGTWENGLKLAYAFCRAKDFKFASTILEPYIFPEKEKMPPHMSQIPMGPDYEKVLFAYISMSSHVPEKFFSRNFSDALVKARDLNKDRYCKLFGDPYMSFQVLDNPKVKKDYFDASCPK
jgi:outer membrane protein OmpA-like peptidoglycan-associated protein